jgi:hypothetical protein
MNNDTNQPNKATATDLDVTIIAGIAKYFANAPKLTFLGTDYTPATLTSAVQAEIDALKALVEARSQLKQQVADTRVVRKSTRALREAIRKYILSVYGADSTKVLETFGFKAPKPSGPKGTKAKAQAVDKALATKLAKKEAIEKIVSGQPAAASAGTTPAKA